MVGFTEIRSTDANVARDCLKLDTRDHYDHIENLAISFSNILDAQPSLQINLGWLPEAKGSRPLRRLKAIAAETARQGPTLPPPPLTKAQLRITARQDAITEWQNGTTCHRVMPGTYRSTETISPANLEHSLNLNHLRYEGRR